MLTMAFFGKIKNLNGAPPAPPRRMSNNAGFEWPQDEFDDEDGDTYEPPPSLSTSVKIPQTQVQDNIYLERSSSPPPCHREAALPPPRLSKKNRPEFFQDFNSKKPPEIDRNDKPGRKKMIPPPVPVSESNLEDVYLDPNEQPEDNDDVYLEPEAAPRPQMRKPPSPSTTSLPTHVRTKPPVPGGKFSSSDSSLSFKQSAYEAGDNRHPTPPTKMPPLTPGVSQLLQSLGGMRLTKHSNYEDREWFAGDCNRKTAEDRLERVNKDGAFLIRRSSDQRASQPFTLVVLYQQKVYNIPVRFLEDLQGYALGKEGKTNEEVFNTLDEMISHHKINQLLLIDRKSKAKQKAHLTYAVRL